MRENLKIAIRQTIGMDMHESPMMDNNPAADLIIEEEDEIDEGPEHPNSGLNDSSAEQIF